MMTTSIVIKGTHCNACKLLIEDICSEIKGVISCSVNFITGETVIEHDKNFNFELFKKEVEGLGQYKIREL